MLDVVGLVVVMLSIVMLNVIALLKWIEQVKKCFLALSPEVCPSSCTIIVTCSSILIHCLSLIVEQSKLGWCYLYALDEPEKNHKEKHPSLLCSTIIFICLTLIVEESKLVCFRLCKFFQARLVLANKTTGLEPTGMAPALPANIRQAWKYCHSKHSSLFLSLSLLTQKPTALKWCGVNRSMRF